MREPGSNVKTERRLQYQKQPLEIISIDEGIEIDRTSEQPENADSPRVKTFERGSNAKVER
jgi:hypothetical protein